MDLHITWKFYQPSYGFVITGRNFAKKIQRSYWSSRNLTQRCAKLYLQL